MRKFNYDENDEYSREVEKFFENVPTEEEKEVEEKLVQDELQMGLFYRELNYKTLRQAIHMAEKSFFWRFYSVSTRLNHIQSIYERLKDLEES